MTGLNRDQINKLIFDNELFHGVLKDMGVVMDIVHLEKFTELVASAEREACAKLVEEWGDPMGASLQIRARGNNAAQAVSRRSV